MSNEVELKFFDLDFDALREMILSAGGVLDYAGIMRASYFDDGSLKKRGGALRLRAQPSCTGGSEVVLTRKIDNAEEGVKSCRELETTVGDFDGAREILLSLGYSEVLTIAKHRSSYRLDGGRVEIDRHVDELAYIPVFAELEASSRAALWDLAEQLGLNPHKGQALNAFEIAQHFADNA